MLKKSNYAEILASVMDASLYQPGPTAVKINWPLIFTPATCV